MAIIDYILHLDRYLSIFISNYHSLTYFLIFFIIFLETGLIIAPFLPGDSLLFIAGTLSAPGAMEFFRLNVFILLAITIIAAFLGDNLNYYIGKYIGEKFFEKRGLIKKEYLIRTKEFYAKYGAKTIVIARFLPIIRTIAPFVAGVGRMDRKIFQTYNLIGAILWTGAFLFAGYFFGQIEFVKDNLSLMIILIVVVSFIPGIVEFIKYKIKNRK